MVCCTYCKTRWEPESGDVTVYGECPNCHSRAAAVERCDECPVLEVEYQRSNSSAGRLLEQVLEHEFDAKHYRTDVDDVNIEIREGLKILEQERTKWEKETREKQDQEREEQGRIMEAQRAAKLRGGG